MNLLLLNQFFYPDVASTAQHAADLARELARQGHQVTVLAGRRAYDDPRVSLPAHQWWEGIRIRRVWHTGFGKRARWRRAADFASFCAASAWRLLWSPRFDVVVAMTTPPLISFLAACFVRLKGGQLCLWMMDLNPDQAVAAGWLRKGSAAYRMLARALRFSLMTAGRVVVLDRFMAARLNNGTNTVILPPWTHDGAVRFDPEGRERFRREHGLEGKFVVMYSGNHSPCHPLDTLLEAARRLAHRSGIAFCFVGGGSEFDSIRRCGLPNVVCLPYQPLPELSASLSAADLHVVVMGDPFVGIVHPCKIYNILRLGIPLLYIGPAESHITDLLPDGALGDWVHLFRHGDAGALASCIAECARVGMRRSPEAMRLAEDFSQSLLAPRMAALINGSMNQCLNVPITQCLNGPMTQCLVSGAGGFIGHHLVKYLVRRGFAVRGVDIKHPEFEPSAAQEFELLDLRRFDNCLIATRGIDEVYHLAANMGGIGFIETFKGEIVRDNTMININMIEAARINGVQRFFFTSSACVYPGYRQNTTEVTPLKEEDAYPADAEDGYGWEKLYMERTCRHYREDFGLETRIVRFHNIYGPLGTYEGGREKSPAAICRKVALANDGDEIEVWGDGRQTRSYCYIDDCVEGIYRLMRSDHHDPLNLGTDRLVSINELVDLVAAIAGKRLRKKHDLTKPQGVRGRNSDNTRLRQVLGWEPATSLEDRLRLTYDWICAELRKAGRLTLLQASQA